MENVWPGWPATFGAEDVLSAGQAVAPYEDESFDLMRSRAVYEHVYNLDAAAKELARVLKARRFCVPPGRPRFTSVTPGTT
jgi:ubiquinone/menaquinone biosynthesis C-methylase UbiE